ncbi:fimbrillin family protein [uncultured Parabacteroides sp.]|uniref:fimbrillin family protein n=1 Tax=uncultured Parabacteroides sp. TaxID=512312 RepID=UPI0025D7D28D|nr:fimbrillin family protein [uncultured Parabacteroides sp.]
MKHIILYLFTGLALGTGCTANLPEEEGSALRLLSVTLADNATTKAIISSGNTINSVDVYVTKEDGSDYATTTTTTAAASFLKFTYSGGSWGADKELEISTTKAKVYGSYPASESTVITNDGVMPKIVVTLLGTDDFSGTAQNDYLYAIPVTATSTARTINLSMNHALAKISFRISKASGVSEEMKLTAIDIVSRNNYLQKGEGTMLLGDGTLNAAQTDSLHLKGTPVTLALSQATANVNCLAAPMRGTESSLSFSIHVQVGDVERVFTTAPVSTPVQWKKGMHYTYTIQINKMSGILTDVSINAWQTDASPNTSIGI